MGYTLGYGHAGIHPFHCWRSTLTCGEDTFLAGEAHIQGVYRLLLFTRFTVGRC